MSDSHLHVSTDASIVSVLRRWTIEAALPLWATAGFDERYGGFHERLFLDGTPDCHVARRTRVQARQIYVYAHAAVLGWYPEGLKVALRAFEFMLARCRSPDGIPGYVHSLNPDGSVAQPLRDLYDHAFILFAFSWLALASKDAQIRSLIDEVLDFLDEHLATGDGSLLEGMPATEPRRQNPHMHLFEAMLALHQTLEHPHALARAERLRTLMKTHFVDPDTNVLVEYFTADWKPWLNPDGITGEPGHHAEWSWLLRKHDRLTGRKPDPLARVLLDWALRSAEANTGFLIDQAGVHGNVHRPTRRCWPQTELAKAWMAEHEIGSPGAAAAADRILQALARHYLSGPIPGGWLEQFDAESRPIVDRIPASTFYHLFGAIAEADRVFTPSNVSAGPAQSSSKAYL